MSSEPKESKDCFELSQSSGLIIESNEPPARVATTLPLPQELRDMIWYEVLAPTGHVSLQPGRRTKNRLHVEPCAPSGQLFFPEYSPILLSLLRTSKQVYEETKDIFWLKNRISISLTKDGALGERILSMPASFLKRATNMQSFFTWDNTQYFQGFQRVLEKCSRLQSITFTSGALCTGPFHPDDYSESLMLERMYLDLERTAEILDRKGVKKSRFVIDGIRQNIYGQIQHELRSLHDIFGVEVWVNGTMLARREAIQNDVR
ncbi:hypothetical protein BKA64DRAFT_412859 [Cadophora sp. MPI-SDFR-AT-0126]|nr:hypothetical protein BKA64DRAFT_412859 [Leotiomycetes sp. MPI-SDFR-AT-0126]